MLTLSTLPAQLAIMSSSLLLLAMGNPLLDMQVVDKPELLEKYSLKANDAVLAEGKQSEMCVALAVLPLSPFLRPVRAERRSWD